MAVTWGVDMSPGLFLYLGWPSDKQGVLQASFDQPKGQARQEKSVDLGDPGFLLNVEDLSRFRRKTFPLSRKCPSR